MDTCTDPYSRKMNDVECMNLGEGRPWWGLDRIWIRVKKYIDDDLMRLLGTFFNQKQNHTYVDDVNSAYLIDEIIWKGGGMMLSANCVINKPWKHVVAETGTTPYNTSVLFVWWTKICNFESREWIMNCDCDYTCEKYDGLHV